MKTDCTKTIIKVSCLVIILTWLASIASWFLQGDMPLELLRYTSILYCTFFACYCCKTGYETYCQYKIKQCDIEQSKIDKVEQNFERGIERGKIRRDIERGGD